MAALGARKIRAAGISLELNSFCALMAGLFTVLCDAFAMPITPYLSSGPYHPNLQLTDVTELISTRNIICPSFSEIKPVRRPVQDARRYPISSRGGIPVFPFLSYYGAIWGGRFLSLRRLMYVA